MAEENTELPVAYRQLRRMRDGRMHTYYIDEDGNEIPVDELDNYRVNEVPGAFDLPEEKKSAATPSAGAQNYYREPEQRQMGGESNLNPAYHKEGAPTGPWDTPYTGPNQSEFMTNLQQKIGNFLADTKLVKNMQKLGGVVEKGTTKAENFMRKEELRRQHLQDPTKPRPVSTETIDMQAQPGIDDAILPGPGAGSIRPTFDATGMNEQVGLDPRLPLVNRTDADAFIDIVLGGKPGPDGGLPLSVKTQIFRGVDAGTASANVVRDMQIAEKQEQLSQAHTDAFGLPKMQDMENLGSVKTMEMRNINEKADALQRATLGPNGLPNVQELTDFIRVEAAKRGIDPDTAVRVFRHEGLAQGVWQSNLPYREKGMKEPITEPSYSAFQMFVGGGVPGVKRRGLGDKMIAETGIDPRDPANIFATARYALDTVAVDGWRQWFGAANNGIGRWDGIGPNAKPLGIYGQPATAPVPYDKPGSQGYSPTSPQSAMNEGGLSGGQLSSDNRLGGYSFADALNPTPTSRNVPSLTAPTVQGPSRSTDTSSVSGFTSRQIGGSVAPQSSGFSRAGDSSSGERNYSERSSGSGVGSAGRSNPSSGGTTASRDSTVSGYGEYGRSRTEGSSGNAGNSTNPGGSSGGSSSSYGNNDAGGTSSQAGSTGRTSHGSESESQAANDRGMGSLGGWF